MKPRNDKPRSELTLEDYKAAYGSFTDADGFEYVRMLPQAEIERRERDARASAEGGA